MTKKDFIRSMEISGKPHYYFDINIIEESGIAHLSRLPYSIRILLENIIRHFDGKVVTEEIIHKLANWQPRYSSPVEIPFFPARVLMQDFTGVPAIVDIAAMRDAIAIAGGSPELINPCIPVDLIVDHSIQVDYHATSDALEKNVDMEYRRNRERYTLLKWAQESFQNFRVVPPNSGICHQVNLEYLSRVVISEEIDNQTLLFPDTLIGTDSHTTMTNCLGITGWGVGGIEAEAVMLGQPYYMSIPEVVGVNITGKPGPFVTATDIVLYVTELLRKHNVVEKFVEFGGPGLKNLNLTDRATIANMSPEYGATMGFFPVDRNSLDYLKLTGREKQVNRVEAYLKANRIFFNETETPEFSSLVELDLSTVVPCVSGPARPNQRIILPDLKKKIQETSKPAADMADPTLQNNSIVIAAITSCTNTSNPHVMLGAGLIAKKAIEFGLKIPDYVKTSLAPGSRVVKRYLEESQLLESLEQLGFHIAAYGCTTCIGNSGPLEPAIAEAIKTRDLSVVSVLSGNRNFEARIHQLVKQNYLMSPMLVVIFALTGRIDINPATEPVGYTPDNQRIFMKDLWPTNEEINHLVNKHINGDQFTDIYNNISGGDKFWTDIQVQGSKTYPWNLESSYIRQPPYFESFSLEPSLPGDIEGARVLLFLGDTVTTDHISPAGAIPEDYPAGKFLKSEYNTSYDNFNTYGARRGNDSIMTRGTFANIRIKNRLLGGKEGGLTLKLPEMDETFVFDAAAQYKTEHIPLIILAGKEYGTGSSRDWAAKGSLLLGVKAVIAESFERIHKNNLTGMGILPLTFQPEQNADSLGLDGTEVFTIKGIETLTPGGKVQVAARKADGSKIKFEAIARLDTKTDLTYYQHGGILPYVLRQNLKN